MIPAGRPRRWRLLLFGAGDFACNLYWQSVTLYLLFFYTDVLGIAPVTAGLIYMAGAIWDGVADMLAGMIAQRGQYGYRRLIGWTAVPLGIAFVLLYRRPGIGTIGGVVAAQLAFRALYALVNIPYAAWSVRISEDSRDRTVVAGARMLFGAGAATIVALGIPWIAERAGGSAISVEGYGAAAAVFALVATPLLLFVVAMTPEAIPDVPALRPSIAHCVSALGRNRAFVTLNAAMAAAGIAATLLNQSVLYYHRHVVGDMATGAATLVLMGLVGVGVVPLWTLAATRIGARSTWFVAAALGIVCAAIFAVPVSGGAMARPFLIGMQVALVGFNLTGWALLPDTIDHGEAAGGIRVEAMAFGVSALVQKLAIAVAVLMIGTVYGSIGYVGSGSASATTATGITWLMIAGPALATALSVVAMAANPLRRGAHAAAMAELHRRRGT
ncbi:glycoside-pentoside-hexuronide family transporter [Sphingomonas cynarae]|uniref:Glycoside-pentoside-hexuronide family transporter n=1 Tax=Sphingomonas cynarae TaxID=930197 RepID=A0ABP7CVF1_9SPHN